MQVRPIGEIVELASGIDALYMSGRTRIEDEQLAILEAFRQDAVLLGEDVPCAFGAQSFKMAPYAFGKYRYRLVHDYGLIGVTPSAHLPALRIQPVAALIHGIGPKATVEWFRQVVEAEFEVVMLSMSRVDLFADLQGIELDGDDRARFVGRARSRVVHEEDEELSGLRFGERKTGTISARIYDKTKESKKKGTDYWTDIWGPNYDEHKRVMRIEFELGRQAIREYGLDGPDSVLEAAGALWSNLTDSWLTLRQPTSDDTRSRWPIDPQWEAVQRASIANSAVGISRIHAGQKRGDLDNLVPAIVGYLSSFAALTDSKGLGDTLANLNRIVKWDENQRDVSFDRRVAIKRKDLPA